MLRNNINEFISATSIYNIIYEREIQTFLNLFVGIIVNVININRKLSFLWEVCFFNQSTNSIGKTSNDSSRSSSAHHFGIQYADGILGGGEGNQGTTQTTNNFAVSNSTNSKLLKKIADL